jgi:membrane dipeptidase
VRARRVVNFASQLSIASAHSGIEFEEMAYVKGLENLSEVMPNVIRRLLAHGYSDEDIAQVVGRNVLRVLKETGAR